MATDSPSRFLQIHTLTSYPGTLLNRDDAGFAKRLPFGGSLRTRVSSQCLKRHWRTDEGTYSLAQIPGPDGNLPMTVRSRKTFEKKIFQPLLAEDVPRELALAVSEAVMEAVLQKSKSRSAAEEAKEEGEEAASLKASQVLVMGRPEVDYLLTIARQAAAEQPEPKAAAKAVAAVLKKEGKKNLAKLTHGAGLDAALFGRMITSDILARCDAAIHVAHAFSVHGEAAEPDYFSAVDELAQEEGETGSGHINSTELTSGLFYSYVVVDVPLLVSNLTACEQTGWKEADRSQAAEVVRRLLHLVATVSPGAKRGSTAPYAMPQMMVVEAGNEAPRTLANAFMKPVRPRGETPDLLGETYRALAAHLRELDEVFGAPSDGRRGLALGPKEELAGTTGDLGSLEDLSRWAAGKVA